MRKILNIYIRRPLLWDTILTGLVCYMAYIVINSFKINLSIDNELIKSIMSDLISTSISLAGFVLASLTIIVTFKDNLNHKSQGVEQSGIGLLFSSKHYKSIVGVFTWAVMIFLALFLFLSLSKLFVSKLPVEYSLYFCIIPISITTLTIFRTILVLYSIIKLQLQNK